MSAAELAKAAVIRAPHDNREDDNFEGLLFTCDTNMKTDVVPEHWAGRWVIVVNEGANPARIGFSERDAATFAHTPSASDAGASASRRIGAGATQQMKLPKASQGGARFYFCRRSAASTSLYVELGDSE